MAAFIAWIGSFAGWIGAQIAARWGFKVALIAAVASTFLAMWAILLAALGTVASLMPASGFLPFLLQFFPSTGAIATAFTAYYGSMLARTSWSFWVISFGLAAKVGAA